MEVKAPEESFLTLPSPHVQSLPIPGDVTPKYIYIDWAHIPPAATLVFWTRKYPVILWLPSCPLDAAAKRIFKMQI